MLVLTRNVGESVLIGDDISITILGIRGSQIRLGVKAPPAIPVDREEIYARKHPEYMPIRGGKTT